MLSYILLVFTADEDGCVFVKDAAKQWVRFGIPEEGLEGILNCLESEGLISRDGDVLNITDYRKFVKRDVRRAKNAAVKRSELTSVVSAWNNLGVPEIKKVYTISNDGVRGRMLSARIAEYGVDTVIEAVENIRKSPFLRGNNKYGWIADFDWFVRPTNFLKVLEGKYSDRNAQEADSKDGGKPKRFKSLPEDILTDMANRGILDLKTGDINYFDATAADLDILKKYNI